MLAPPVKEPKTHPSKHGCAAWFLGSFLYMFLALEVIADAGAIAVPFQAIMGAVFSLCLVGVAYLVGLLLRIPAFARLWYSSALPSVAVIVVALGVLFFGQSIGFVTTVISPETNTPFRTLHPAAGFGSVFAAVFAALHFSTGVRAPSTDERNG